jgi:hypothetical protein
MVLAAKECFRFLPTLAGQLFFGQVAIGEVRMMATRLWPMKGEDLLNCLAHRGRLSERKALHDVIVTQSWIPASKSLGVSLKHQKRSQ